MSDKKQVLCVAILCTILLTSPFGSTTELTIPDKEQVSVPAMIDFWQMVLDPFLEKEPDAFVNSTSGEFLYDYKNGTMHLNWTHTAGTELNFRSEDDDTYPSFHDFVYFTQSFEWPYEETPIRAIGNLNWSLQYPVSLSGLYFDVYVWLIDSSGHWKKVYPSGYDQYQFMVNLAEVTDIWGGMIEDEFGVQEDPEDTLTIGVGLAPTHYFDYYEGEEKWQTYSGSINVSIYSIKLYAIMDVESAPANHLSPLFNTSFTSDIHDLFPFYGGDNTYVLDRLFASTKDSYGNIYLTGESSSSYEIYIEDHLRARHQFIIKYDPSLNRKWVVRNLNQTMGRAITCHDGYLYTSGFNEPGLRDYNLILTKWDLSGRRIWQKEWGGEHDQMGIAIGVHQDGAIYVIVSDCNFRSDGPYWNSSILKFGSTGNPIWNKSLPYCTFLDEPGELWVFDTHMLYSFTEEIICIDLEGNVLWQKDSQSATCEDSGDIYFGYYGENCVNITKIDSSGNLIWSGIYEVEYPIEFHDIQFPIDMTVTASNELLVLIHGGFVDETYRLLSYSLNGTHIQTWTIGDSIWPKYLGALVFMESTSTGLLYCSFMDIWTQAFATGPYTIPNPESSTIPMALLLTVGGGFGVAAIVGIYIYKNKQS